MLSTTVSKLQCPSCTGALKIHPESPEPPDSKDRKPIEIHSGHLKCSKCSAEFLILAGTALLVEDTRDYLLTHVKGISKIVPDQEIPAEFRDEFVEAKSELEAEHIEEDLEAERVNALYLMNHYLKTDAKPEWWKPFTDSGSPLPGSPLIDRLIRDHWDHGPFAQIGAWIADLSKTRRFKTAVELGCGVGGLQTVLKPYCDFYLGADSSFASIALARHLALGVAYPGALRIPEDLLRGPVPREIRLSFPATFDGRADFVVMDFESPGVAPGWDLTLSLNMIDMLADPAALPRLQYDLLQSGGIAVQSCPYIWHEAVAAPLRETLPEELRSNSARAVEWLYQQAGFEIEKTVHHQPWLFFKHIRQLEIYSVHMFLATKKI